MQVCQGGPSTPRSRSPSQTKDPVACSISSSSDSDASGDSSSEELPAVRVRSISPLNEDVEEQMIGHAVAESLIQEPTSFRELIGALQTRCGVTLALTNDDWDTLPRTHVLVRREKLLEDALHEARKARFDHTKLLNVEFVDEAGLDSGGPSREFWRLFVREVARQFCVGDPGTCLFAKNVPALENEDFKMIGKLTATSIVQGGPGLPIFLPAVYHYLCFGKYSTELKTAEVPDLLIRNLLEQLEAADSDNVLRGVFDESNFELAMLETGYRRPLSTLVLADKAALLQTLKTHVLTRAKAETDQFSEGLSTVSGIAESLRKHPDLMATCFTYAPPADLTAGYFRNIFDVLFSDDDSVRARERATRVFFKDFIEECEDGKIVTEAGETVGLESLLVFFSGAKREPPQGFPSKPLMTFCDSNLATASTCTLTLTLPKNHDTYKDFRHFMILSLVGNDGFGTV